MAIINSIQELILKDFIKCSVYKDLSVLGEGTAEELNKAWLNIMSEYYETAQKQDVITYLKLVRDINLLNLQKALIDSISGILNERYSIEACNTLRSLYPKYKFTEDSFKDDLSLIKGYQTADRISYDKLTKQLEKLEINKGKEEVLTDTQRYAKFIHFLADINKYEGVKYDLSMTVLEYAVHEKRLYDYIEHLNEHSNGR